MIGGGDDQNFQKSRTFLSGERAIKLNEGSENDSCAGQDMGPASYYIEEYFFNPCWIGRLVNVDLDPSVPFAIPWARHECLCELVLKCFFWVKERSCWIGFDYGCYIYGWGGISLKMAGG